MVRTLVGWPSISIVVGAFVACSAGGSGGALGDDDDGAGAGTTTGQGAGVGFDAGSGGSGADSGCSEEAKLVYVVGTTNELYSFHPPTLAFEPIGMINCPQGGGVATPFSMAVDRSGIAWVLFNDGNLYNVDITDASCTATGFVPNQLSGFHLFGMGFTSDSPGSNEETLYVASYDGVGIGRLDRQTLQVSQVGTYDQIHQAGELTGTGDARLFGFFLGPPITVAEIDKSTSHILSQAAQPTIDIGAAWAFAFWGGDFWLFTSPNYASSQVDQYRPAAGTTSTVVTSVGFNIVGAGVSTCAPVTPPN